MAEHNNDNGRKEVNKVGIIACVVGLVLIAVIVVLAVKLHEQSVPDTPGMQASESGVDGVGIIGKGNTKESEPSDSSEAEEGHMYGQPLFVSQETTDWYFPSATEASTNAVVAHSELNQCDIYVEIFLNSTQEVIFRSQIIKPGETLREITLGKELESGTHECVMLYHLVDSDTGEEFEDNVRLGITITIQ